MCNRIYSKNHPSSQGEREWVSPHVEGEVCREKESARASRETRNRYTTLYAHTPNFVVGKRKASHSTSSSFTSILGMWSVVPVETFETGTLM